MEKLARRKEKVTWHLRRGCGVDHIESIEGDPNLPGSRFLIYGSEPQQPEGSSGNWKGTN